jgi:hypothetical protein
VNVRNNPAVKLINKDNVLVPNSSRGDGKKHLRHVSNDDQLMEVEGFDGGIQQQNFIFNNQKNQKDTYELAISKPPSNQSNRLTLNRRFQNKANMN